MQDSYRIKEISQLFGIGPDSLRYYEEIGILSPRRGPNGYRLYGMSDIYRLNVIKDLRQIGFSMQLIKEYLENKTLANTIELLREEKRILGCEIEDLRRKKKSIGARIAELLEYKGERTGEIKTVRCPARLCVRLSGRVSRDEEIDFALSRLHKRFEHKLYMIANYMIGATQNIRDVRSGERGVFDSVFIVIGGAERANEGYDFTLPEGEYLSLHYRGSSNQGPGWVDKLLDYADAENYVLQGEILELYKIDIHETNRQAEYLTELQVMAAKGSSDNKSSIVSKRS